MTTLICSNHGPFTKCYCNVVSIVYDAGPTLQQHLVKVCYGVFHAEVTKSRSVKSRQTDQSYLSRSGTNAELMLIQRRGRFSDNDTTRVRVLRLLNLLTLGTLTF